MPTPSPRELLEELLRRNKAKEGLVDYISYLDIGIAPAAHHRLIIDHLERVERGEIKRLMIFMPPGSAKTTYASVLFPSWYFGRHPTNSLIFASHTEELATTIGRRVRNIVASTEHNNVFETGLAEDRKGIGSWETSKGGQYFAVGVGGAVSGRRADVLIVDDPVRGREDADSLRAREVVWAWYLNDALPRLKPAGAIVLIMTRWHLDDLAGRILDRERDRWSVLSLPMEAQSGDPLGRQPGERLWPSWFTGQMVEDAKRDVRGWNSLYQQNPAPDEGTYFHADWFGTYRRFPAQLTTYGASDFAVTQDGGDFTVHIVVGRDPLGNIYLLDCWRGQTTPDQWIDRQCDLILRHRPVVWFGEAGPIRRAVEPFLRERMGERQAWCRVEWLPSTADKQARCRAFQGLASMGKVLLPVAAAWSSELLGELLRFPAGKHDDHVDALSLLGRGLQQMPAPSAVMPSVYPWENRSKHQIEYDPFSSVWNTGNRQGGGHDPHRGMWAGDEPRRPSLSSEGVPPYWRDALQKFGRR
jgi:predicted phage terminase large subunit-like protein